jgi:hypothetical protein
LETWIHQSNGPPWKAVKAAPDVNFATSPWKLYCEEKSISQGEKSDGFSSYFDTKINTNII